MSATETTQAAPQDPSAPSAFRPIADYGMGEVERAQEVFDQLAGYANDLGLLAEEIDTDRGELLGNFPQAFSHVGLITAAAVIDAARERES